MWFLRELNLVRDECTEPVVRENLELQERLVMNRPRLSWRTGSLLHALRYTVKNNFFAFLPLKKKLVFMFKNGISLRTQLSADQVV